MSFWEHTEEYSVPTIFEETRFAGRKAHQCHACCRWIDQEDYTRTAVSQHSGHGRGFNVVIICRDCRAPKEYRAA